jgi:hypothetical protein
MFKTALSLLSPSLILMGWVASPSSQASDYPPGYEIFRHCQVQGPVSVCAINREGGNFPRLEIFYAGEIRPSSVWIRLNGRDGAFGGSSFWQIAVRNNSYVRAYGERKTWIRLPKVSEVKSVPAPIEERKVANS